MPPPPPRCQAQHRQRGVEVHLRQPQLQAPQQVEGAHLGALKQAHLGAPLLFPPEGTQMRSLDLLGILQLGLAEADLDATLPVEGAAADWAAGAAPCAPTAPRQKKEGKIRP